jgi:hypothetical protein
MQPMANDPPIKSRLESKLFTNNAPAVQRKLDDCLAVDPLHIAPGQSGDHVKKIREALDILRQGGFPIPVINDPPGTYLGTAAENPPPQQGTTAAAVLEYKQLRGIHRDGRPFDAIVGRMTITQLDNDLLVRDPKPAPPPPPPAATQVLDVIVHYQGFLPQKGQPANIPMSEEAVFPQALLDRAQYSLHKDRRLLRIGSSTSTTKQDSATLLDGHVRTIEENLSGKTPGLIFVYGSSSGGRNVLDMAIKLTSKGLPLRLVAPIDAAFFPNETATDPGSRFGRPKTPVFQAGGAIDAKDKRNFIQQVGNHAEFSISQRRVIYFSHMDHQEVHGDVAGFKRVDRSDVVASETDDDQAHIKFSNFARNEARLVIMSALIELLPTVVPPAFIPAFAR